MTAADVMIQMLRDAGVKRVYGIVADSLKPVVDAVRRTEGTDWVHVRHEELAAVAAGAEAQLTGRPAVCAGSSGPGNPHLVMGFSMPIEAARRSWPHRMRWGSLSLKTLT
jgi:pyruvate dehydrogenase (quinone)